MTECDEVAENMRPPRFASFDAALAWVREQLEHPGETIVSNVAEALYTRQRKD